MTAWLCGNSSRQLYGFCDMTFRHWRATRSVHVYVRVGPIVFITILVVCCPLSKATPQTMEIMQLYVFVNLTVLMRRYK
jgi:hypothetical protein